VAVPRGTRIGTYEIVSLLGAGGMGEVYRAHDTRLGRDVAIKILANRVSEDPVLLARIEREARLLASLNHPSIATIHGVEEWQGTPAIVMELIEGETLAVRLFDGPLPPSDVVRISRQVADALCAAHDRGIVHRDLKPANIHIRPDGAVKVLDFGLAKSVAIEGSAPRTQVEQSVTSTGSIMGTAPYMSPEQARGQDVDRRTDIWAFGCTVYEMLTGTRAFYGPTPADTIVAILSTDPDWSKLPAETPIGLRVLLERCLQREPRNRLRDLADASFDFGPASSSTFAGAIATARRRNRARALTIAAAVVVAIGVVGAGIYLGSGGSSGSGETEELRLRKFEVQVDGLGDQPGTFTADSGPGAGVVISPDGRRIVYPAAGRLWVRELSELNSRPLDGTDKAVAPSWSPDSQWVAYAVGEQLRKSPISGGSAIRIAGVPGGFSEAGGIAWSDDGTLYYTTGSSGVFRVSSDGGEPGMVIEIEAGVRDYHDAVMAGGLPLLITHYTNNQYSIDRISGSKREILFGPVAQVIRHAAFSRSGHVVYQRVGSSPGVWGMRVDPATLRQDGESFMVAPGGLRPSVAADGTLVYVSDETWGQVQLSFLDRSGRIVTNVGDARAGFRQPALSPSGDRAMVLAPSSVGDDLFTIDLKGGAVTQFTFTGVRGDADWDPDGRRIAFSCGATSREGGVCVTNADGSGEPSVAIPGASQPDFAPDGKHVAYLLLDPVTRTDLWTSPIDRSAPATLIRQSPAFDFSPRVSPDGKFVAYGSAESGNPEVYVAEYPAPRRHRQVSAASGAEPRWNPKGGELFYLNALGQLQAVPFDAAGQPGKPATLFSESVARAHLSLGYAPSADGQQFLVVREIERGKIRPRITVVENWFVEFAEKR
jgi:Tol biopolymer transport system component